MIDLGARLIRLFPDSQPGRDWEVTSRGDFVAWDEIKMGRAIPTEAELLAVDMSQPTVEELRVRAVKQILKDDVPDAWRTSTNAQQRVAWALKWALIETRRDFTT